MNLSKTDYYALIGKASIKYKAGANVTQFFREQLHLNSNTPEIIEVAYDLQAGSYIQAVQNNPSHYQAYTSELAEYISQYLTPNDRLLEVGCGEATTMVGIIQHLSQKPRSVFGFDISLSRIKFAQNFWQKSFVNNASVRVNDHHFFVADLFSIPLKSNSIDIIYTSHSIEPNGSREVEALQSIFRVARRKVLLFEPYYEKASLEGKARMKRHGYIANLPTAIKAAGGRLCSITEVKNTSNPLNPTYLFDVDIQEVHKMCCESQDTNLVWSDPITQGDLTRYDDCFYAAQSGIAYPILRGIPCLRPENSIVATQLFDEMQ